MLQKKFRYTIVHMNKNAFKPDVLVVHEKDFFYIDLRNIRSDGTEDREMHWNFPGYGFKFDSSLALWNLFSFDRSPSALCPRCDQRRR